MKKALLFLLLLMQSLFNSVLLAQRHTGPLTISESAKSFGFADEKGTWEFEIYPGNIIKTIFKPNGYTTPELISNAVILKPGREKLAVSKVREGSGFQIGNITLLRKEGIIWYHLDGKLLTILHDAVDKDGYRGFALRLQHEEKIFGGGERALPMDRRGHRFNLYNNPWYGYEYGADNLNFSVPFFISSMGYGIFFDNPSKGYADIGKTNPSMFEAGFVSNQLNFYIIPGSNVDAIMRAYTNLTGRQAIPPRWVFGNFMSRFGYRSEEQVKEIYGMMKAEEFPLDAVIFDLFWFGDSIKGTMGNLDWTNKEKWPDPKRMINDLAKENVKTVLITEPFVLRSTPNYEPSKQYHSTDSAGQPYLLQDFYFGEGGLIDIFRKDAQDWFWSKYHAQIRNGVAGWWGDLGEPEKHPAGSYHNLSDLGFKRKFSADEVHNLYGHYWSKMLHEKYAKHYPNTRLFHLNRAGFAGSQRYNVFPWTGDVHRNWNGLKAQLPILLGMSLSGIPYIHSDAGGFAMGQKDPELYTRWLQFAAFTPIFRPHGTAFGDVDPSVLNIESEPVFYPEPYKGLVKDIIELRYRLTPYNYTLAYEQSILGRPLMRPMFYHYPGNESYKANGQYMWGENILVAPVFEQGAITKKIYLPKGKWFRFSYNNTIEGGRWVDVEAGIEGIPMFIREGAFVPTVPNKKNMEEYSTQQLSIVHIPSTASSSYILYDDDGKTNDAIAKKQFELLEFTGRTANNIIRISVKSNGGKFNGRPRTRKLRFELPLDKAPASVSVNGKRLKASPEPGHDATNTFHFHESAFMLSLAVEFSNQPLAIEIRK
ncbi:MAG TPA: TIM-barrel domain-containing protein [Chitinophagaceae bacterium]|nr:TIM-barrel domain-containing protein [Chitinophagaceae bacterium]